MVAAQVALLVLTLTAPTAKASGGGGGALVVGDSLEVLTMTAAIGEEPVLWVNVKSIVANGPYASDNMEEWDEALLEACDRYPHMRIYDWASDVKDPWFIPDGIHFTSEGYAERGRLIADALLAAFPNSEPLAMADRDNCLISVPLTEPS